MSLDLASCYTSKTENSREMNTIKNLERLQQLHLLIARECTGSPPELAIKMGISERSLYNLKEQLKDFGADIACDRTRKTYYYKNDFKLEVSVSVLIYNQNEVTDVFGGGYFIRNRPSFSTKEAEGRFAS